MKNKYNEFEMLFVFIYRQKGLCLTLKPVAQNEARPLFSYFGQMVDRIHPTELQLNKANSSDTEAPFFLDLNLCIFVLINGTILSLI